MGIFRDMWLVSSALAWFSDERPVEPAREPECLVPPGPPKPLAPRVLTVEDYQYWPPVPEPDAGDDQAPDRDQEATDEEPWELMEKPSQPDPGVPMAEFATAGTRYDLVRRDDDEEIRCELRAVSFTRRQQSEFSTLYPVKVEGQLWLLRVNAINRSARAVAPWKIRGLLLLVHADGRAFGPVIGPFDSDEPSGVYGFSYWPDNADVMPGATVSGGILFILPHESAEYAVAVRGGAIRPLTRPRP